MGICQNLRLRSSVRAGRWNAGAGRERVDGACACMRVNEQHPRSMACTRLEQGAGVGACSRAGTAEPTAKGHRVGRCSMHINIRAAFARNTKEQNKKARLPQNKDKQFSAPLGVLVLLLGAELEAAEEARVGVLVEARGEGEEGPERDVRPRVLLVLAPPREVLVGFVIVPKNAVGDEPCAGKQAEAKAWRWGGGGRGGAWLSASPSRDNTPTALMLRRQDGALAPCKRVGPPVLAALGPHVGRSVQGARSTLRN